MTAYALEGFLNRIFTVQTEIHKNNASYSELLREGGEGFQIYKTA
jgi:hypothetical protein